MTTTADTATLAALAKTPLARQALEAAEAEQHAQRRAALARLAAAEAERREAIAEAAKPIPELREAHREARQRLHAAAMALRRAENAASDAECAADARVRHAALPLADLGGDAIEALRATLAVERRIALSLDSYRQVATPNPWGGETFSTVHVDAGGADRLRRIEDALRELDRLEHDAEVSPAMIARRCQALREEIEGGPPSRPPAGPRTHPRNLDRKSDTTIVREAVRRVLRR